MYLAPPSYFGWQLNYQWKGTPLTLGFAVSGHPLWFLVMPYWFAVILSGTFAAAPWLPSHFSLRTLLIATTLFALALGTIVWLAHR